ncbi:MAG: hemolysin family protein [Alphaproteobacteria bacterium]
MTEENEDPPSTMTSPTIQGDIVQTDQAASPQAERGLFSFVKNIIRPKSDTTLRETIEEYIEDNSGDNEETSFSEHEKTLISNILDLKDMKASDVMIPRADIIALNVDTTPEELLALLADKQYSRIPVYQDTLDNVIGALHIKDILETMARGETLNVRTLVRDVPIISPSMQVLDLLLQMRMTRKHMVLVVDEYGGIDGLINIGDVIEAIVGEIDDEHDPDEQPSISIQTDGTILADARYDIEEFEEQFGRILNEEERQEHDTLGGLIFDIAGRVPARGEVLTHDNGMVFEILEADPRRISKICIRNIPDIAAE